MLSFSLFAVELFLELLDVAEEIVLKSTHFTLRQVLLTRLTIRTPLAEIVALVRTIFVVFFVFTLILFDRFDELSGLFGHHSLLLPALLLFGLFVFEGGVGNDSGLELIETQLIRILFGLPCVLNCFEGHQTLLSLLFADTLLI